MMYSAISQKDLYIETRRIFLQLLLICTFMGSNFAFAQQCPTTYPDSCLGRDRHEVSSLFTWLEEKGHDTSLLCNGYDGVWGYMGAPWDEQVKLAKAPLDGLKGRPWRTWSDQDWGKLVSAMETIKDAVDRSQFFERSTLEVSGHLAESVSIFRCYQSAAPHKESSNETANSQRQRGPSSVASSHSEPKAATSSQSNTNDLSEDDLRAPYTASGCVSIRQHGAGVASAYKKITNNCRIPIAVTFCFARAGDMGTCLDRNRYGVSDTIAPDRFQITADAIEGAWTVWFYVCDMSNPKKNLCLAPKQIAGAGMNLRSGRTR